MKRTTLRAPGKRPDDLNQSRAFIEKAGEIGAAEDSSRAGELLSALALQSGAVLLRDDVFLFAPGWMKLYPVADKGFLDYCSNV